MNKIFIWVGVLIVVFLGSYLIFSGSDKDNGLGINLEVPGDFDLKIFTLTGENFKYTLNGVDNPDIIVNEGDHVRIEFSSNLGLHDWVVDEFGASTERIRDGEGSVFVDFIADKKGTFEYYCSVGKHRANGMKGNFIVN